MICGKKVGTEARSATLTGSALPLGQRGSVFGRTEQKVVPRNLQQCFAKEQVVSQQTRRHTTRVLLCFSADVTGRRQHCG